jgi:uncharacterized repeat protein (TIGR03803 family)
LLKVACILFAFCAASAIALPGQVLTTLHSFEGSPSDGSEPLAGLVQATDGDFYGTTWQGGANGDGVVFKITSSGVTTLYSFCSKGGCTDGSEPVAGLAQATDGNFYGTTVGGGANGLGTVFKITPSGTLTTLYNFCSKGGCFDGSNPDGGLVLATDGNFYGTTSFGGTNSDGTAFRLITVRVCAVCPLVE